MKNIISRIVVSFFVLSIIFLSGCGSIDHILKDGDTGKKSDKSCTMTLNTHYGGTDVAGRDLGSGISTEIFTVREGDYFREDFSGHWLLNSEEKEYDIIARIKKIGKDTVTLMLYDGKTKVSYDTELTVHSLFTVSDGTNYLYQVIFSDGEAPVPEDD